MKKKLTLVLNLILVMASAILLTACAENAPRVPDDFLQVTSIESPNRKSQDSPEEPEVEPVKPHVDVTVSERGYEKLIPYTNNMFFAYDGKKYFIIDRNNIVLAATNFTNSENVKASFTENSFDAIAYEMQDNCFIAFNVNGDGTYSSVVYNENLVALDAAMNCEFYISDYRDNILTVTWPEGFTSYATEGDFKNITTILNNSTGASYLSPVSYGHVTEIFSQYVPSFEGEETPINNFSWQIDFDGENFKNHSHTYEDYSIIFTANSVNKEGWVSACLGVMFDDGNFGTFVDDGTYVAGGFYNINTGEYILASSKGLSEYVFEENGCSTCTVMGHYASMPVTADEQGNILYQIFDLEKRAYVDNTLYTHVEMYRNDTCIGHLQNGKVVYLNENMIPDSIECDALSTFVGDLAMARVDGQTYIINQDFDVLSDALECSSFAAAGDYYEFSPDFSDGTFIVTMTDGLNHLVSCNYTK